MAHKHLNDAERINKEKWLTEKDKQPVNWKTLVEVLCDMNYLPLLVKSRQPNVHRTSLKRPTLVNFM